MIAGVTIWEIIRAGRLPNLSGFPHLPGNPHLHLNRPLILVQTNSVLMRNIYCPRPFQWYALDSANAKFNVWIDLIHDVRHLCTRSRIDGIKAMSRGISGGKQVIKFANTSNRGRVSFSSFLRQFRSNEKCTYRILARFTSLLFAMRSLTVTTAYKK